MKLKHLYVNLQEYGASKGLYTGEVTFSNKEGTITLNLDPNFSQRVLELCSEALVRQASQTATMLSGDIIEQTALLSQNVSGGGKYDHDVLT